MYCTTTDSCCSVMELQSLGHEDSVSDAINHIKEHIFDCVMGDYPEHPTTIIAFTRSEKQQIAEQALKKLGFRSRVIDSRHDKVQKKKGSLKMWTKFSLRGIVTEAELKQKYKEEDEW